ncbi:MAG: hypothetical protein ABIE74_11695 [Pseudomonadota bacterium]
MKPRRLSRLINLFPTINDLNRLKLKITFRIDGEKLFQDHLKEKRENFFKLRGFKLKLFKTRREYEQEERQRLSGFSKRSFNPSKICTTSACISYIVALERNMKSCLSRRMALHVKTHLAKHIVLGMHWVGYVYIRIKIRRVGRHVKHQLKTKLVFHRGFRRMNSHPIIKNNAARLHKLCVLPFANLNEPGLRHRPVTFHFLVRTEVTAKRNLNITRIQFSLAPFRIYNHPLSIDVKTKTKIVRAVAKR